MTLTLTLLGKEGHTVTFTRDSFPVTVGRGKDNDVVVSDHSVSRKHAQVFQDADRILIKDLSSAYGTFVNGEKVTCAPIWDGDRIRVGHCELLVKTDATTGRGARPEDDDHTTSWIRLEDITAESVSEEALGALRASTGAVLSFFQQAGRILEGAFELDSVLGGILDLAFRIIPAERGFVLLTDPDTGDMAVRAQKSTGADERRGDSEPKISATILDYAIQKGRAVLTSDAESDSRFGGAASILELGIRSAICVPLKGRTKILGAIYVESALSHQFSQNDLKLLTAVGAPMGVAVENTRLHEAEVKTQRLAAVGQAIASLSHCIKNILNAMEFGSYLLEKGIEHSPDKNTHKGWNLLKGGSSRLKDLMLDMLAYSKPREPVYEPIAGNNIPKEVFDLLHPQASAKGVEVEFDPDGDVTIVELDAKAIYRAILNLASNAVDACPADGGKVVIRTRHLAGDECFQILVEDNGSGIAEENLPKLGRAFFSTKGSQGTGLGLSVAYKAISEHHGTIDVVSQVGNGTSFTVTLPLKRPAQR